MKSLFGRFKEQYESETGLKVQWSNLDKEGNLTVGIVDKAGNERFWLHVVERNGEIIWF